MVDTITMLYKKRLLNAFISLKYINTSLNKCMLYHLFEISNDTI